MNKWGYVRIEGYPYKSTGKVKRNRISKRSRLKKRVKPVPSWLSRIRDRVARQQGHFIGYVMFNTNKRTAKRPVPSWMRSENG